MHLGSIKFSFTVSIAYGKKRYSEFRVRKRSANHTGVTRSTLYIICVMKGVVRLFVCCLPVCLSPQQPEIVRNYRNLKFWVYL